MKPGLGQGFIDARLVGAKRTASLQQQRDAIERQPRAQVAILAGYARFRPDTSLRERRVGRGLIAQAYRRYARRDRALGHRRKVPVA
jgi:hypothetical protein